VDSLPATVAPPVAIYDPRAMPFRAQRLRGAVHLLHHDAECEGVLGRGAGRPSGRRRLELTAAGEAAGGERSSGMGQGTGPTAATPGTLGVPLV